MGGLDPSGIHAAHVALKEDGFVVLRPRRDGKRDCYEIPKYPQRDLSDVHIAARKELGVLIGVRLGVRDGRRVQALADKWRSRHTSIPFEDIHVVQDVDWGAVV
tara:strand:- start:76 stop:387 length:312 start_codon:yes stop_codon:yes gene_type:complete